MGALPAQKDGQAGILFRVWAPSATAVSAVGDFNGWQPEQTPMQKDEFGVWSVFVGDLAPGALYQFALKSDAPAPKGETPLDPDTWQYRCDPFARTGEVRPARANILPDPAPFPWTDDGWQRRKHQTHDQNRPMSVYEVHLGSWKRQENGDLYSYAQLAKELVPYVKEMGFTHVELMPVMEYPLDASWGYQIIGFYAVNSRYGSPSEFKKLVDAFHAVGIGVLLDWVPGHFCKDDHGLRRFDGTPLYEPPGKQGEHDEWGTCTFDYSKGEVVSFLISNALYWLEEYHVDGIRVDAVSSMLYLDYGRGPGGWKPNIHGGNENLEAIEFLRALNDAVHDEVPGACMIAEESTAWALVTRPPDVGGLGFNYKWNMGWMNDTLRYMGQDSLFRKFDHERLTFSMMYAFSENYILPLSHDEVVHGKHSLLDRMPGDYWRMFANLRLLFLYQYLHPGKKLLFMGSELAPFIEWRFYEALEWHLLEYEAHKGIQSFVRALNSFYSQHSPLWKQDGSWEGFQWISPNDREHSILVFQRIDPDTRERLVCVLNFTPVAREGFRIGLPLPGTLEELFNSDDPVYGGSGVTNSGEWPSVYVACHDHPYSIQVRVPPLGGSVFRYIEKPELAAPQEEMQGKGKSSNTKKSKDASAPAPDTAVPPPPTHKNPQCHRRGY